MKRSLALASITVLVSSALVATAASGSAAPLAPSESDSSAAGNADRAIKAHPGVILAATGESYAQYSTKVDASGAAHVRYTRTYRGLRVYGGDSSSTPRPTAVTPAPRSA